MQKNFYAAIVFALAPLLVPPGSELWGQTGYRLDRPARQIVADTPEHWDHWVFPVETVEVLAAGVQPRRWTMDSNAADGIVDFLREQPPDHLTDKPPEEITLLDAVGAGSNREGVLKVLDRDPATYWEPAPLPEGADIPSQWWFTLDLGRVVVLNRIALRFVDEEMGSPFLLFDVLTSDGQKPLAAVAGESLEFLPVLQLVKPNTTRRLFEIDFSDAPGDARENVARYLQVVVRGSRLDRGEEVEAGEYERLPEEERGAVEYMKRRSDGGEVAVPEENYRSLPEDRRGPIRYYLRERPRLAELEVRAEGEDLARRLLDRGGSVALHPAVESRPNNMLDGDISTYLGLYYTIRPDLEVLAPNIVTDLGAFFWINSLQIIMNLRGSGHSFTFGDFQLDFSDGSRQVDGSLQWVTAKRIVQEPVAKARETVVLGLRLHQSQMEAERHSFAPVRARYFRLVYEKADDDRVTLYQGIHPVSELRMFGEGYQPRVSLESPLIDPRGTRTLTAIEWDADTPPGTRVLLQTRTSSTKSEVTHYFDRLGKEVTAERYDKLKEPNPKVKIPDNLLKGDIVIEEIMGSDASAWSEPYPVSGSRITSPSPRNFVQMRATLVSDSPEAAATLRSVRLKYAEPLAQRFLGEVTPARVESLAVERPFSLYVRPDFGRANPGFDGLLLTAPDGLSLEGFTRLLAGPEQELTAAGDPSSFVLADAVQLGPAGDSLLVSFPLIEPDADLEVLRLDFTGRLYSIGGQVQAFARFSGEGETVWQQVDGGNAVEGVDSNRLLVVGVQERRQLMTAFELPAAFTPNGDGVNDEAVFRFAVVLVGASRAVAVSVFDLSGRLVRTLRQREEVSAGTYEMRWDGADAGGVRVPPGVYALRFQVEADEAGAGLDGREVIRTVAVAY